MKGKSLAEVAAAFPVITEQATRIGTAEPKHFPNEPEPEATAGERWSGDVGRLGKFVGGDLPLDSNGA